MCFLQADSMALEISHFYRVILHRGIRRVVTKSWSFDRSIEKVTLFSIKGSCRYMIYVHLIAFNKTLSLMIVAQIQIGTHKTSLHFNFVVLFHLQVILWCNVGKRRSFVSCSNVQINLKVFKSRERGFNSTESEPKQFSNRLRGKM